MNHSIEQIVRVIRQPQWFNAYDVFYYQKKNDGGVISVAVPQPLVMRVINPDEQHFEPAPFLRLEAHDAQTFMDQLWDAGLRPSEGTGSAGSLAATQKHLNDMRALVFKTGAPT